MIPKIVQQKNAVLRRVAKDVDIKDIKGVKIFKIITDMKNALHGQKDGVAIAAPQIGESLRIFVVAGKIFDENFKTSEIPEKHEQINEDMVFINPEFTKKSKTTKWMKEGCLSVRPFYGEVRRATNATVIAHNEKGEKFIRGAGGLLAHIFQHEIDHLNGILFIDKARDVRKENPEEQDK